MTLTLAGFCHCDRVFWSLEGAATFGVWSVARQVEELLLREPYEVCQSRTQVATNMMVPPMSARTKLFDKPEDSPADCITAIDHGLKQAHSAQDTRDIKTERKSAEEQGIEVGNLKNQKEMTRPTSLAWRTRPLLRRLSLLHYRLDSSSE